MSILTFSKAQRRGKPTVVSLYGLSGSGKTYSALLIAGGLVGREGKIVFIDTERRGEMYAGEPGMPDYDYAELTPPFTPQRYVQALNDAEDAGYTVIILDSVSHEWEGEGGVVETADLNGFEGLLKWAKPKAQHKLFMRKIIYSRRAHYILCLRAKELSEQEGRGKEAKIIKRGIVPIQEKGFKSEMDVQLFFPDNDDERLRGIPVVKKCPKALLPAFPPDQRVSAESGRKLAEWVGGAKKIDTEFEKLKDEATAQAEKGTAVFRQWWTSRSAKQNEPLRPFLANFQSVAAAADAEAIGERDEDPFANSQPPKTEGTGGAAKEPQQQESVGDTEFASAYRANLKDCKTAADVTMLRDANREAFPLMSSASLRTALLDETVARENELDPPQASDKQKNGAAAQSAAHF